MALTVSELRGAKHAQHAYLLIVEGWRYGFVSNSELTGSGVASWIGTSFGDRELLPGLQVPSVAIAVDIEEGLLENTTTNFTVLDTGGNLAALLNTDAVESSIIGERLTPKDDPAPATLQGIGGEMLSLHEYHIGIEAIGPSGERRYYAAFPDSVLPGFDHAALDEEHQGGLAPVEVSREPKAFAGRRVALYRLYRDNAETGVAAWPGWLEQYEAGALLWWGTLGARAITVTGRTWTLACTGPASWLERNLNQNAPAEWFQAVVPFAPNTDVGEREDLIAVWFVQVSEEGTYNEYGVSLFDIFDAITQDTHQAVIQHIATVVNTVKAAVGPAGVFTSNKNADAQFYAGGVTMRIDQQMGETFGAIMHLVLHEKVWRLIGWDPVLQRKSPDQMETEYDVLFSSWVSGVILNANGAAAVTPGTRYWEGIFTTFPLWAEDQGNNFDWDNQGADRNWKPITPGGVSTLDPLANHEVFIGIDPIYCEGQMGRPPHSHEIDGNTCTDTRWWVFRGKIRYSLDEEPQEICQVAKCSWVGADGVIQQNNQAWRTLYIERWEDPRQFGLPYDKIAVPWASSLALGEPVTCSPLAVLGYTSKGNLDAAHHVLLRLLLSTGTSEWDGPAFEDGDVPVMLPGGNAHPDATGIHWVATDAEIADLGLQIPADLVDWQSFQRAADALPDGWPGQMNRVKVAFHGAMPSLELLRGLLTMRGWGLCLRGRKYGVYSMFDPLEPGQADFVIGQSDLHGSPDDPDRARPGVTLRPVAPFDRAEVEYNWDPVDEGYAAMVSARARDPGAPTRRGNRKRTMTALGSIEVPGIPSEWTKHWRALWTHRAARWFASGLRKVTGVRVSRPKGQDIFPGAVVRLTNPWPPNSEGTYGLTDYMGRVISVTHEPDTCAAVLDILVQPGSVGTVRYFAPMAFVVDDVADSTQRYDPARFKFFCYTDWTGHGEGTSDLEAFVEPAWSSYGGNAKIEVWQFDGVSWAKNATGFVAQVSGSEMVLTQAITGVFYNRMYTMLIMAPYTDVDQAEWVKRLFIVVTKNTGKFGGADTQGWRLHK